MTQNGEKEKEGVSAKKKKEKKKKNFVGGRFWKMCLSTADWSDEKSQVRFPFRGIEKNFYGRFWKISSCFSFFVSF